MFKKYPRQFKEAEMNENGYPLYHQHGPEDGGSIMTIKIGSIF